MISSRDFTCSSCSTVTGLSNRQVEREEHPPEVDPRQATDINAGRTVGRQWAETLATSGHDLMAADRAVQP